MPPKVEDTPVPNYSSRRLGALLRAILALSAVMLVLTMYALTRTPIAPIIINGALLSYCIALGIAVYVNARQRVTLAASIMSYALCAMALIDSVGHRESIGVLLLLPVLAVVLTLPFLAGRALGAMLGIACTTVAIQLLLAGLPPLVAPIPADQRIPFVVYVGELITIDLIVVIMARNHRDLQRVAQGYQTANAALHETQVGIEAQVAARTAELHTRVVQLEQQTRSISLLQVLTHSIHGSHTSLEAYGVVARVAPQLFAGVRGMITRYQADDDDMALVLVAWGRGATWPDAIPRDGCVAVHTHQPFAGLSGQDIRCEHVSPSTERSLCIPILLDDVVHAVIHLEHLPQATTPPR